MQANQFVDFFLFTLALTIDFHSFYEENTTQNKEKNKIKLK